MANVNTLKSPKIDFSILDNIRGIAALYVVINHCRGKLHIGGSEYAVAVPLADWSFWEKSYFSVLQLTSIGREFVILFFVLSGFSIASSLSRRGALLSFYKRRLIRLYPPYIFAILWAGFVFWLIDSCQSGMFGIQSSVLDSTWSIVSNLLYMPRGSLISQFWSLPYEVIFYLIIPFLFIKYRNLYYVISLSLWFISWLINWRAMVGNGIAESFLLDYNIYFMFGVLFFEKYDSWANKILVGSLKKLLFVSCILFLLMVVLNYSVGDYNKFSRIIASCWSVFLIANFLSLEIKSSFFSFLGRMSYTLYVSHYASIFLFLLLMDRVGIRAIELDNSWWGWLVGVVFCTLISYPLYIIAERPSIRLLSRVRKLT